LDKISSFFWLILSLLILKEARFLPFGTLSRPRSGFFPFILGMALGILSLILLIKSWLGEKGRIVDFNFFPNRKGGKNIILTLGVMFIFYIIFESVGFLLATFFLILVLIKFIEPHKWFYSIWIAALISLCSYLLFEVLLKSNLPKGILEGLGF
jgi:putative tricarboxylic transport membrane protein